MKSNYKKLGRFIREVSVKNKNLNVELLLGVSITKRFIPSIANTIGTDMSKYKIVKRGQFAYGPVTSRNGEKISIALLTEDKCLVSTSYTVFEIVDTELLDPEYLMMWFRRSEFDRYARYMSHGTVRELFGWNEICNIELPIPSIQTQREIVSEYNVVNDRILLNKYSIQELEDVASTVYKQWFVDFDFPITKEYAEFISEPELEGKPYKSSGGEMKYCDELDKYIPQNWDLITLADCTSYLSRGIAPRYTELNGCLVLNQKCIRNSSINFDFARRHDFNTKKITEERYLKVHDVVVNSTGQGTLGRVGIVKYLPERTVVDTHITILRPNDKLNHHYFWFSISGRESEIENLAEGTTGQTELKREYLFDFKIVKPNKGVQDLFGELMAPVISKIEVIEKELPLLMGLKEICLQRLSKV